MTHAPVLPVLLPLLCAAILMARPGASLGFQRRLALTSTFTLLAVSLHLLGLADSGTVFTYALGDWPAPFGIVLVVDRLAAALVLLAALLACASLVYATAGTDAQGRHFHILFQLQILGINGAFLTGDLFNLFVFFEILLLASYALLLHGGGRFRTRAAMGYVLVNLMGSALFLIALGLLHGTLGTLNLADAAARLQHLDAASGATARLACALLITVFLLKAALLPLAFWLPQAYGAATAPVAALFAILTKVGVYALLRLHTLALLPSPASADLLHGLPLLGLATVLVAALGTLAAGRLQALAAWLVLASAGTLLSVLAEPTPAVIAAALYYLFQSTLAGAGLFLLADLIARRRGAVQDRFEPGGTPGERTLATAFVLLAVTLAAMPPFSGFLGKLMLFAAVRETAWGAVFWGVLLVSGFLVMAALARGGSRLFWETRPEPGVRAAASGRHALLAMYALAAAGPLLALFAAPAADYAARTAEQILAAPAGKGPRP